MFSDQVNANQAAQILGCSRAQIERLQLQGALKPIPTIAPCYIFWIDDVYKLKELKDYGKKSKVV